MNASHTSNATDIPAHDVVFSWLSWDWSLEAAIPLFLLCALIWVVILKVAAYALSNYLVRRYAVPQKVIADDQLFCFSCKSLKKAKDLELFPASDSRPTPLTAKQCPDCSSFLHPPGWLPELVSLFADYDELREDAGDTPLSIDARFPLSKFVTWSDVLAYIIIVVSAVVNCFTIAAKFRSEAFSPRDQSVSYDFTLRALAIGEFGIVVAVLCRCLYLSFKTTSKYHRVRPFRVFLGLFAANAGKLANANVLATIRLWDIHRVVRAASVSAYVEHNGPKCWNGVMLCLQLLILIPVTMLLVFGPAAALFIRLMQMQSVTNTYLYDWNTDEWIAFLSFLNNFRFLVTQPDVMTHLGIHLLSSKVFYLFGELLDATSGVRSFFQSIVLLTTSSPSECYEIFKEDSGIWKVTSGLPAVNNAPVSCDA